MIIGLQRKQVSYTIARGKKAKMEILAETKMGVLAPMQCRQRGVVKAVAVLPWGRPHRRSH